MSRLRPCISILTALLLMTILGMAIVIVQLTRELVPMRAELRTLRNEVGRLTIDDPTQFHAILIRDDSQINTWKWRVWVPEGHEYQINFATQAIPKAGYPTSNGMMTLSQPGESWIEYCVTQDVDSFKRTAKLITPGGSVGTSAPPSEGGNSVSQTEGVGHETESFAPNKTVLLARHRTSRSVTNSTQIGNPAHGFMVWLEPTK